MTVRVDPAEAILEQSGDESLRVTCVTKSTSDGAFLHRNLGGTAEQTFPSLLDGEVFIILFRR